VEVQPGQNANQVARQALQAQNARPFDSTNLGSEGFTVSGLEWTKFPVVQNYNGMAEEINGQTALVNTHTTLDGVGTNFDIDYGGLTTRCPSLVDECDGRQKFDRKNDVAWLNLDDPNVLGVAWFGTKKKRGRHRPEYRFQLECWLQQCN